MAIHLTERDIDIMLALARSGFLSIDQIQKKWFKGYKYCSKRLKQLREYKYIDVAYIERFGKGNYHLLSKGVEFVNDYYGTDYKSYPKSMKINHFLSCGEFYLSFPQTTFEIDEYRIEYQRDELISDIYIRYYSNKSDDKLIDMLVEIDNTKRLTNIREKISKYSKLYESRKWKEAFDLFPKCLIVTDCNIENLESPTIPIKFISYEGLKNGLLINLL